ncbi:MAG: YqhA family protein [Thermomicrobiales bacterium]
MRAIFGASRFIVGLAVVATFIGSAVLLIMATLTVIRMAIREVVQFDPGVFGEVDPASGRHVDAGTLSGHHIDRLGVEFIQVTDIILLGTVLYIVSLGLYQLFIDHALNLPRWLVVDDLNDLKRLLIGVTVVLLGVTFLGDVVEWDGDPNILHLGAAVALVIAALAFILWVHPDEPHGHHHPAANGSGADPPPESVLDGGP